MKTPALAFAAALLFGATPLAAQQGGTGAPCRDAAAFLSPAEQQYCFAIAQAVEAAQPQLGIVIAGGNPTLGSQATGTVRLGSLPRFNASAKLSAAWFRLPDIRQQGTAATERLDAPAPALSAAVAVGLLPGYQLTPTLGGLGSVDLLGSAAWLPFRLFDAGGFADDAAEFAFGVGARVGLLRESFTAPGVAVSVMYRHLGRIRYGDVCPGGTAGSLLIAGGDGYRLGGAVCPTPGDRGEFAFDLSGWSSRATVGKRFGGFGLAAGGAYDRFRSDVAFGLGATPELPTLGRTPVIIRASQLRLTSGRWSAFANASRAIRLARLTAEIGWMQGGAAIDGFNSPASEFDPGAGTLFGSVGVSLGL